MVDPLKHSARHDGCLRRRGLVGLKRGPFCRLTPAGRRRLRAESSLARSITSWQTVRSARSGLGDRAAEDTDHPRDVMARPAGEPQPLHVARVALRISPAAA